MSFLQIAAAFIIPLLVNNPFVDASPSDLSETTEPNVAASGVRELFPLQDYLGSSGTNMNGMWLSSGQLAGIVTGSLAVVALILVAISIFLRRRRKNTRKEQATDAESGNIPRLQYNTKEESDLGEAPGHDEPAFYDIAPSTIDEDANSGTSHAHSDSHVQFYSLSDYECEP